MPIALGPMAARAALEELTYETVPAEWIKHHFVGQDQAVGVYAKELILGPGCWVISHRHTYDHLAILASGTVILTIDSDPPAKITGPMALTIKAGAEHRVDAISDAVWFCVHATEETSADRVDAVLIAR